MTKKKGFHSNYDLFALFSIFVKKKIGHSTELNHWIWFCDSIWPFCYESPFIFANCESSPIIYVRISLRLIAWIKQRIDSFRWKFPYSNLLCSCCAVRLFSDFRSCCRLPVSSYWAINGKTLNLLLCLFSQLHLLSIISFCFLSFSFFLFRFFIFPMLFFSSSVFLPMQEAEGDKDKH